MTPARRMVLIDWTDLGKPTIVCHKCRSSITFPLEAPAPVPSRCSTCNLEFGKATQDAIAALTRFYASMKNSELKVEFLIEEQAVKD